MGVLQMEVVGAAEAMPADKYDFAPTQGDFKGVRNFGSQVKHLAEANYEFFQGWNVPGATAVDPKSIEALKTKDDIVKALKDSYVYAHAAVSTITPQNAWDSVPGLPAAVQGNKSNRRRLRHRPLHGPLRANGRVPPHEQHHSPGQPPPAEEIPPCNEAAPESGLRPRSAQQPDRGLAVSDPPRRAFDSERMNPHGSGANCRSV